MAIFCKNCGAQVQDGMNVCPNCGTAVSQAPQPPQPDEPKKNNTSKIIIIVLSVLLVVAIAVGAFFFLSGSKDDDSKDSKKNKEESSYNEDKDSEKDKKKDNKEDNKTDNQEDKADNKPNNNSDSKTDSKSNSTQGTIIASDYKGAIDKLMKFFETGDAESFLAIMPGSYTGEMKSIMVELLEDEISKPLIEEIETEFGANYKCTYKIVNVKKYSQDELNSYIDTLKTNYITLGTVTEVVEVEIEAYVNGQMEEGDTTETVKVIKEDGTWKIDIMSLE